ncbi:hypothetical protein M758_7G063300 [Ceratodon purpureus]|nr:hypothetical protein M758_7G063300 [Ceratodon purpureus]
MIRVLLLTSFRFGSGRRPIFWRIVSGLGYAMAAAERSKCSPTKTALCPYRYNSPPNLLLMLLCFAILSLLPPYDRLPTTFTSITLLAAPSILDQPTKYEHHH